jgi:integral membrane protein (TIGR01906 family)
MKVVVNVARFLFIICLPVLLFTITIAGAINCRWIYTHGFEKYNVRQSLADNSLNLNDADMKGIATDFIHYFNSSDEYINLTVQQNGQTVALFNSEEIIHFKDVKKLFRLDYYVTLITFVYCLAFVLMSFFWRKGNYRKKLAKDIVTGSAVTLGLMVLLGIGILLDFDSLFLQFHFIAFSNDFWSAEGNMLLLFPGGFWYDVVIYCVITIVVLSVILVGISWAYLAYRRRKE